MAYTSKAAASLGFANRNFVLQLNHLKVNTETGRRFNSTQGRLGPHSGHKQ